MTKADIRLLCGIIAAALLSLLLFRLFRIQGGYAEISYNGSVMLRIPLLAEDAQCYLITNQNAAPYDSQPFEEKEPQIILLELEEADGGDWMKAADREALLQQECDYNILLCQNGEARMLASNCPDQICVRHRSILASGESIICLPHKIVIQISNGKEQELDGVTY